MQEEMQHFVNRMCGKRVPLLEGKNCYWDKMDFLRNKRCQSNSIRNKASNQIFLAFASYMGFMVYQMDVKSAFLYGEIDEEVYVTQPKGFEDPFYPKHVYRVVKALYGLHQAPRAVARGYHLSTSQDKYVQDMLRKFNMESVRPATTPYEATKPKSKDEPDDAVNVHLYRRSLVSQWPTKLGLWYHKRFSFVLEAYSDMINAGSNGERNPQTGTIDLKSTARYGAMIYDVCIAWSVCGFILMRTIPSGWICVISGVARVSTSGHTGFYWLNNFYWLSFWFLLQLSCILTPALTHNPIQATVESMAALKYRDEHNMIGFLEKPKGSTDYHQVIDFLLDSHIRFALVTDSLVYDSLITQFWSTASLRSSELGPPAIVATIDGTPYTITESLVRSQLQLQDEGGIVDMPIPDILLGMDNLGYPTEGKLTFHKNKFSPQWRFLIHTLLHCLSTKSGSWESVLEALWLLPLIVLCEGMKYNWFSLYLYLDETRHTKPYHAIRLTSKMFANMRLNFHEDHMPLLAAMLPPPQAAIAAGTSREAAPPNSQTDHEIVTEHVHQIATPHDHRSSSPRPTPTTPAAKLNEPVSKPSRPIPTSPSAQVNQQGPSSDPHVESSSKDNASNPDPNVADDPLGGSFFASPSRKECDLSESDNEQDEEQHVDSLIKLAKAAAFAADTSSVPADATRATEFPPSSSIHTDAFVHGNDVPTGTASAFSADPSNKGWSRAARKLYEEEQAELARVQEEMKKKRQEDVINSAKYYNDDDWSDIMGQVHANTGLTADLLDLTALDNLQARNLRRSLKRPGADVEQPGSKKSKSSTAPQTPVPTVSHQSSAGVTPDVHQSPFVATSTSNLPPSPNASSHPDVTLIMLLNPTTYSTRRKSLAPRKMPSSEVDLNAPDTSFIQVLSADVSDASDDDTDPLFWHIFAAWEVIPTGLVSKTPLAGNGMILWGDLHVLFESTTGGSSVEVWDDQQEWVIHSWKLFPFSGVHVLETFSGKILYMFADTPYPLSASLMKKMLKHKLEVEIDGIGNDMTYAMQLGQFIKNQLASCVPFA
ncbi:putative ribonuclease H-like domain-containing protein [Tanacetum coccineum]